MHWIDPDYLPEITGTVDQLLVNKHGEADGFLLTDGGEVRVSPHLSSRLLRDVRPGQRGQRAWNSPARRSYGCGRFDRHPKGADSRPRPGSAIRFTQPLRSVRIFPGYGNGAQ